jgi:hypothetical protein
MGANGSSGFNWLRRNQYLPSKISGEPVGRDFSNHNIVIYVLKPVMTSLVCLTPDATRVQAQLSDKSALGSKKF